MGIFNDAVITAIGDVIRNNHAAGNNINYTKISVGNGIYDNETDIRYIVQLKNEIKSTTMPVKKKIDSNTVYICGPIDNEGITVKTPITEIALYALDDEDNEVLFAYIEHNPDEEEYFHLPTETSFPGYSVELKIKVESVSVDKIDITRKLALDPKEIGIDIPELPQAQTLKDILDIIIGALTVKRK